MVKVKWSRYRPCVAQRVGRGIALLFHDRGTRRGWVVSRTPQPNFTPGKDPVPILQEAGWAPGPVWTGGKSRSHRDSIPDRPARSQSLYWLSYRAHRLWSTDDVIMKGESQPQRHFFHQKSCAKSSTWKDRVSRLLSVVFAVNSIYCRRARSVVIVGTVCNEISLSSVCRR